MDIGLKLLEIGELKDLEKNNKICSLVIDEFQSRINENINFNDCETEEIKLKNLEFQYVYTSKYISLFFEILNKYNYNSRTEIRGAINYLGHLINPNENKETISLLLNSPTLQDISFNGVDKFLISSKQYGDFEFKLASEYFRNNKKVFEYMKEIKPCDCHGNTYFMSDIFPDFYSITSLCPREFEGYYHHSYAYYKDDDYIIDLRYNFVMKKDSYYKIYQPKEVSSILNRNVRTELSITNQKTNQYYRRCALLKIALYKEYLHGIGYEGNLEDAPDAKKLEDFKKYILKLDDVPIEYLATSVIETKKSKLKDNQFLSSILSVSLPDSLDLDKEEPKKYRNVP